MLSSRNNYSEGYHLDILNGQRSEIKINWDDVPYIYGSQQSIPNEKHNTGRGHISYYNYPGTDKLWKNSEDYQCRKYMLDEHYIYDPDGGAAVYIKFFTTFRGTEDEHDYIYSEWLDKGDIIARGLCGDDNKKIGEWTYYFDGRETKVRYTEDVTPESIYE